MYRLSFIISILVFGISETFAQSPHGDELKMDCIACHTTTGWDIPFEQWNFEEKYEETDSLGNKIIPSDSSFNHFNTNFPLTGMHETTNCTSCHPTLVFNQTTTACIDCHTDVHFMTVGNDCIRCHTSDNWLVDDIPEIHEENGFPLIGQHSVLSCVDCHSSETNLRFDRIGNDCYACHQMDFENTESPNHLEVNFSINCTDCHSPEGDSWNTDIIDHSFFPLTLGHDIQECAVCHTTNSFSDASSDCISCHQNDFTSTASPDHELANFSIDCTECHTTNPGWTPANFNNHDAQFFPIYSGEHEGEWTNCIDCHSDPNNYQEFQCIGCHINPETDDEHEGISGYTYEDNACLACHPNGDADMAFDHNTTNFPLTGSHIGIDCIDCHSEGFVGTSTNCVDCHSMDFNGSINPNHSALNLPNDCINCHTTEPDWMPATFDIHDEFYLLEGAHAIISNNCIACHNGDYTATPNDCIGCHLDDFNTTVDPNHQVANFSTDCTQCHTQDAWQPSTFDHDAQYFPIYSGAHEGEWNDCIDCHSNPNNYQEFQCIGCHINPETDEEHEGISGYIYEDNACLACHPNGDADMAFNHNTTNFPLTGSHIGVDCIDCHSEGFVGTSTNCVDCHSMDFDGSINPNHSALNLPNDCINCHTTEPDWMPATFDIHDDFYLLEGAHTIISNDCIACHNGDYTATPNDCVGCHLDDFNATVDPNHPNANFSTDCTQCHTQDAWQPSTFDHDTQFFPIYSGAHEGEWNDCIDCHSNPNNYQEFQCIGCHINPETDEEHEGISGYIYEDNACLACHPNGDADMAFDHNTTNFPLTGSHIGVDCIDCHSEGFVGTSTNCVDCHSMDFDGSINPNHSALNLPNDCINCHTTEPDWMPATFDIHDDFYLLEGAHAIISNDCIACHNGDYTATPNDCVGCHLDDFNVTVDPNHQETMFSTDCVQCHNQEVWTPSTFDHNEIYVLEGAHAEIAQECLQCHANGYENTPNTCVGCHQEEYDNTMDPNHTDVQFSTDCITCHSQDAWEPATFDHDGQYFPIYSGSHDGEWSQCIDCHTNSSNYSIFSCTTCHINPETDEDHLGIGGYIYEDNACFACHPTGEADEGINHDETNFPLTGAHMMTECIDCHMDGYQGTSSECNSCHNVDFNNSLNPNHSTLGISTDCISCHTTDPGWEPATFDIHDDFYALTGGHILIANDCAACHNGDYNNTPTDCVGCHQMDYEETLNPNHTTLNLPAECINCHTTDPDWVPATFDIHDDFYPLEGAHLVIANDCALCHNGDYNNTPNTCIGCHQSDYDETVDPNHAAAMFPTDCLECHSQDSWSPSTFDHDGMYFPIYSGSHDGEWDACLNCHTDPNNFALFTCIGCHVNPETDNDHIGIGGYIYEDNACLACHPNGEAEEGINHDDTNFPLTGAHTMTDCIECHENGYQGTSTDCNDCHNLDYNETINPNHSAIGLTTDCISCHTTDPGWAPATFDIHNDFYELTGAHIPIANDCVACHNGDYNSTPSECVGCHQPDYETSINPDHQALNIPNDCAQCHSTDPEWMPATFDIHNDYYVLNGAHALIANDCATCHNGDYNTTPNTCYGCHQSDYEGTTDPDHVAAMFSIECLDCHTEDAWTPSTFDHSNYWILNGAHASISNECLLCHANGYENTPNTCIGCHQSDYDNTNNPNHSAAGFPTDCTDCHNEDAWTPSTFDHDNQYFPIYSGKHEGEWNLCVDCHLNANDFSLFSCIDCHEHDDQNQVDDDHSEVNGYSYESNACLACHPTGED